MNKLLLSIILFVFSCSCEISFQSKPNQTEMPESVECTDRKIRILMWNDEGTRLIYKCFTEKEFEDEII